jgi:hypothetical protein
MPCCHVVQVRVLDATRVNPESYRLAVALVEQVIFTDSFVCAHPVCLLQTVLIRSPALPNLRYLQSVHIQLSVPCIPLHTQATNEEDVEVAVDEHRDKVGGVGGCKKMRRQGVCLTPTAYQACNITSCWSWPVLRCSPPLRAHG